MNERTIWQLSLRYRDGRRWRTLRLDSAYVDRRTALDTATMMQQRSPAVAGIPERWFVAPIRLSEEVEA